jgi:hypothetical protein
MTRPFTIYVLQSAHTDIGYTHPQEQIALMYLDYYDQVLDLCRRTVEAPEPQRFKWTCETSWQVQHYVTHHPEREAEFLHYVRTGQIEITASYLHFTDLIDADAYRRSMEWVVTYCRRHDLPLRCAMHCDINGWPWAVADILAGYGIPYFCSQVHLDGGTDPLGRRGSVHYQWVRDWNTLVRPDAPFRIPQAFWWQGPAGGRVLHWLGEHYLLGNMLSISGSYDFHAEKTRYFTETDRTTAGDLYAVAQREVPRYLARLREEGYPYDILLVSSGGFFVDNSPPDERWCEVVARWNREHGDIYLRTATLGEWFDALCAQDTGTWPLYQVAWPDHWAHGLGSSTARVAQERRSQRHRADVLALVEMAHSAVASSHLATALEQERLALEHTFDAWSTTARPMALINDFQHIAKELTFHRTELYLDEAIGTALRALIPTTSDGPKLYVGAAHQQDGVRLVHFAAGDGRLDPMNQALVALDGHVYPFQRDDQELSQCVAALPLAGSNLSSFGLATQGEMGYIDPRVPFTRPQEDQAVEIETTAWRLRIDPASGGLVSLRERPTNREWVNREQQYAFGQFVQEVVVHPLGRQAVGNMARLIALGVAPDELRHRFGDGPIVERMAVTMEHEPCYTAGPVFDAVELRGKAERIGCVQIAWRCYHALPLVELLIDWDKVWSDLPEAAYVAFPFAVRDGHLALETGGGFFQPGSHDAGGQLPGTCSSYYTIQRAARITSQDGFKLFWLPLDAPLVMTNSIDYNRWETDPWAWNGFLASMPVNHYWHTNFPTSQRGHLRLRYRMVSPASLQDFADDETLIQLAQPVETFGWR